MKPTPALYNLRLLAPGHYQMAKFDAYFNVEAVYNLTRKGAGMACDCPAGLRTVKLKPCKHQRALPYMLGAVNTDRFYDIENRRWHQPLPRELSQAAYESNTASLIHCGCKSQEECDERQGCAFNSLSVGKALTLPAEGNGHDPEPPVSQTPPAAQAGAPTEVSHLPPSADRPVVRRRI